MTVMFWRYECIQSGMRGSSGQLPNTVLPSRRTATVAAYGFGGRYTTPSAIIPNSPCSAWNPAFPPAMTRFITSGVRGMSPGPASPVAPFGSTVPAIMCSSTCRGSQSAT
jgi:hypothetical protein